MIGIPFTEVLSYTLHGTQYSKHLKTLTTHSSSLGSGAGSVVEGNVCEGETRRRV